MVGWSPDNELERPWRPWPIARYYVSNHNNNDNHKKTKLNQDSRRPEPGSSQLQIKSITARANLLGHFSFHTTFLKQTNFNNTRHKNKASTTLTVTKKKCWADKLRKRWQCYQLCGKIYEPTCIYFSFIWIEITAITHASHIHLRVFIHALLALDCALLDNDTA
jgi:hypothetical protein